MTYNVYAGYYEIYVTDKRLRKPFNLIYQAESISALNAYLMDIDKRIAADFLIDKDIDDGGDYHIFEVKNGKPKVIENEDDEY